MVVGAGWGFGLAFWGRPQSGFGHIPFWVVPVAIVLVSFPAMMVAGFLLGSTSKLLRRLGVITWVLATLGVAYAVSFSHFGGFCLDPEDVCVVTWLSRLTGLLAGVASIVTGRFLELRRLQRRPSE